MFKRIIYIYTTPTYIYICIYIFINVYAIQLHCNNLHNIDFLFLKVDMTSTSVLHGLRLCSELLSCTFPFSMAQPAYNITFAYLWYVSERLPFPDLYKMMMY